MSHHEYLSGHVKAGEIVKPWLMLGPFYEDLSSRVQGLTFFENPGSPVGESVMMEIMEDARKIMPTAPCEGMEQAFRGKAGRWSLVRSPEQYLSWGTYNISNHLGAVFLNTLVSPNTAGTKTFHLALRITERALVWVNGKPVYDSAEHPTKNVNGVYEHQFSADLSGVENSVMVALFRVARMAQVGMRLELDDEVDVRVIPVEGITFAARQAIEDEVAGIRFARDVFYPEHDLGFRMEAAAACSDPDSGVRMEALLLDKTGAVLHQARPQSAGFVSLVPAADLPDNHYTIVCRWYGQGEAPITETTYAVHKVSPVAPIPGYNRLEERKQVVLAHYADNEEPGIHSIWTEVARYALGQYDRVDESVIRRTCEFISARKDCADFVIQGILRLMYWERAQRRLSSEINAMMKDTVLNFKYWVDEPGDTVMYMGSENHRFLFHVAEWMAGHLFPVDEFTNSRQNGLYHTAKAYVYITEWLRQRGRFGFDEWHSNSYYPICVAPLLNLLDFSTHEGYYKLRQMTAAVLDQMFFNTGADAFQGILGTTHGRSYGIYVKYPDFEGTSALNWLYFGTGSLTKSTSGMAPVCAATSSYNVPEIIYKMANDRTSVIEARRRQGILRTPTAKHADFVVYRTPDYMLSAAQDHRKGEYESSTHIAQVTLGKKNVIFWSCPHTVGEGSGLRPDYWSGSTTLPRAIQYKNVLALTWKLTRFAWMSHCFFEQERFDEVRFAGNWAFARVDDGYIGIYSTGGMQVGSFGQYAGRELQCTAPETTWLVECGRKVDWGSFDAFVRALTSAEISESGGQVVYQSPSIGAFVTGWDVCPTVNGDPIQVSGYSMVDSPWAYEKFGSGEMTLRYDGKVEEIWFNQ